MENEIVAEKNILPDDMAKDSYRRALKKMRQGFSRRLGSLDTIFPPTSFTRCPRIFFRRVGQIYF